MLALHRVLQDTEGGSTIALRRAWAAALTWGAAPPWNRHTLPPGMGGLPHRSPARLAAVHWLMGFWSAMGSISGVHRRGVVSAIVFRLEPPLAAFVRRLIAP